MIIPTINPYTQMAFLDAINQARTQGRYCGSQGYFPPAPPLLWSDALYAASYAHCQDLALSKSFDHIGSGTGSDLAAQGLGLLGGSSPWDRGRYHGYDNQTRYTSGENIGVGQPTIEAIIQSWLGSEGHCANLMNPEHKEVGMALYAPLNAPYTHYWAQLFGRYF